MLCVLIRIRRFLWEHTTYLHFKEIRKDISSVPPDLVLLSTLTSSNSPCLEHIFMVPKVFDPFKFYCVFIKDATQKDGNILAHFNFHGYEIHSLQIIKKI